MKKHNLAFIDIETTGLDPDRHEIVEIAGVIAKQIPQEGRGAEVEEIDHFEVKIKPEHIETAEPEALRINGYNEADWLFATDLTSAMKLVAEKTKDCILVGLNIAFDASFLDHAFKKTGVKNEMHFHRIEVMSMAFAKLYHTPEAERFSLKALAEHFKVENPKAHTALADIQTTFEIYKKLIERQY